MPPSWWAATDRKSTRLNSSHLGISYAVFCSRGLHSFLHDALPIWPDGIIAGLKAGGVYADMSTIAPDVSREVAAAFAQKSLAMLDAPISGSPVTLQQGNASVMVGGD